MTAINARGDQLKNASFLSSRTLEEQRAANRRQTTNKKSARITIVDDPKRSKEGEEYQVCYETGIDISIELRATYSQHAKLCKNSTKTLTKTKTLLVARNNDNHNHYESEDKSTEPIRAEKYKNANLAEHRSSKQTEFDRI